MLGVGAAVGVVLLAGGPVALAALQVGIAHKARTLCSGVFVSRRDPAAVLNELQSDDLAALRYFPAAVDAIRRSVTASLFGLVVRRAVYREGLGCALVLDGLTPPALADHRQRAAAPRALVQQHDGALDAVLARAFSEPVPERPRRTRAVVVMSRGRIVAERYAQGFGPETPLVGWSMTKSLMNALVGILIQQRRVSLDMPVPVAEWQAKGDARASITFDHLLRMSSGLRFDEGMEGPRSDVLRMLFQEGDAARFAASADLIAPPGTQWHYTSGASTILASAVRQVLHDDADYLAFPRRALFERLGMSSAVLETDARGTFLGSSYMFATARDWATFGQLYLQDGMWNGERVLPEGWVAYTTTPAPADPTKRYGAHVWLQIPVEYAGADPRLPAAAFHAAGHEAQFVTVVPSREAVIVRLGRTRYPEAWDHAAFVRDVLAALDRSRAGG
jgi:hypothetical protein